MRCLSIYKTVERGVPPSQEEMAEMGKRIEEGMKAGFLLAVEGCMSSAYGTRIRLSNGDLPVTNCGSRFDINLSNFLYSGALHPRRRRRRA
jgi:hypothetical protein